MSKGILLFHCTAWLATSISTFALRAEMPAKTATAPAAQPARRFTTTLQTGFAETFQLTLGGVFGKGPALQNRVTLGVSSLFLTGDTLAVSGWTTNDWQSRRNDWLASLSYKFRAYRHGNQSLHLGGGLERWRFPSVLKGANDWISVYSATYATRVASVPFQVQSNSYTVLSSPLTKGTLINTQAWFEHPLLKHESLRLTLRHGPQHTYSWNFYGTNGHRVLRYAGALVLTVRQTQLEAGIRPQYGLQSRIPDNKYWYVLISRTF